MAQSLTTTSRQWNHSGSRLTKRAAVRIETRGIRHGHRDQRACSAFEEIRWHQSVDGRCQFVSPDADAIWRSRVFPGLWLDGKALFAGNLRQVLDRLQEGLSFVDHERFVAELAARRRQ
jgi:hypothetical protein